MAVSRQLTPAFSSNLKAPSAEAITALTRLSISSGNALRAAAKIMAFSSFSEMAGRNVKQLRVPTSSPSTITVPSIFTDEIKLVASFSRLDKCAARLSTKRCVNLLCSSSDSLSSIVLARCCHSSGSSVQLVLCVI